VSHTPPPFHPSAPPVKKDRTLVIVLIILAALALFCICGFAAFGFFGWSFVKKVGGPIGGCAINFEVTREALMDYAQDHGGRLPNAATWQDDIKEYVRKNLQKHKDVQDIMDFKVMEPEGEWGCYVSSSRTTGMAFNSELSGKLLSEIQSPETTPLLFEIERPRRNAAEPFRERPRSEAPTIMGEPRGWVRVNVRGEVNIKDEEWKSGGWNDPSPESSREPDPAPSSDEK
jgi:hypothetical protein